MRVNSLRGEIITANLDIQFCIPYFHGYLIIQRVHFFAPQPSYYVKYVHSHLSIPHRVISQCYYKNNSFIRRSAPPVPGAYAPPFSRRSSSAAPRDPAPRPTGRKGRKRRRAVWSKIGAREDAERPREKRRNGSGTPLAPAALLN